ncbi:MAG: hypothetical protein ACTSUN_08860 [Promethearchaeota archaeon]
MHWNKIKYLLLVLFLFLNLLYFINESNRLETIFQDKNGEHSKDDGNYINEDGSPYIRPSAIKYFINLTNPEIINNTRHYTGTNITIEGIVYDPLANSSGEYDDTKGINVSIVVDGILYPEFKNTTGGGGVFKINFTIPNTLTVNVPHRVEVNVTDDIEVLSQHYIIYVNTSSIFQGIVAPTIPFLSGENFTLSGTLRYENGTTIKNANVSRYWYQDASIIDSGSFLTNDTGNFPIFIVPSSNAKTLDLKLNYSSPPEVNYSETLICINVFSNISCFWDVNESIYKGDDIRVRGYITSSTHPSLKINNRSIRVYYDGDLIAETITDSNGTFSIRYTIPNRTGLRTFQVEVVNYVGKNIISKNIIEVQSETAGKTEIPEITVTENEERPFETFLTYFIPIMIGVGAALTIGGYLYYRRVILKSSFINIPLAPKIRNFKILKDSGRMEESITYLFKAIYMELINGKFGRGIKETETIRDFAIICVKEFKLNPATIYPFIQNIEKVIYDRPFMITEEYFNKICDLFRPVYFELTGYDFILNF